MPGNYFDRFDEKDAPAPEAKAKPKPQAKAASETGNYFDRYTEPGVAASRARSEFGKKHPIARRLDSAARGAADFLSFGWADEAAGTLNALPQLWPGGESFKDSQARNIAYERAIDATDRAETPYSRGAGEVAGFGGMMGLGVVNMTRGAVAAAPRAGSTMARVGTNALKATTAGATYGALSAAGNAEGDFTERAKAAVPGAALGGVIGLASVPAAALVGHGVNALRERAAPTLEKVANRLRGRFSTEEARVRAADLRAAGIDPSAINVMDDATRGYVAAAAKRQTPGRDVVQGRADAARVGLPGRVRTQAAKITDDPRSVAAVEGDAALRLADATVPPTPANGEAGTMLSARLNALRDQSKAEVDNAYKAARAAAPNGAHLPQSERPIIASDLRDAVREFPMADLTRLSRVLDDFDKLSTITVRDMFDARTRLTNLRMSNDPVEATAAARLVRALDNAVDEAVRRDIITGDKAAVDLWRDAIAKRRTFGQLYEGDDMIQQLTERTRRGGGEANLVAPEDASAALFGRGANVSNRQNATRDLTRIRDRLGEDSAEWIAVQDEALGRILGRDAGREDYGRALTAFEQQNPELAALLISPRQRATIEAAQAKIAAATGDRAALEVGKGLMTPSAADDVVTAAAGLTPEQQQLARLAARRQVERRAGESPRAALATAENIAIAPEAQARTRALLPEAEAEALERGMGAEVSTYREIQQVAPRTGSQTNLNSQDEGAAGDLAHGVVTALKGPHAIAQALIARLRSAGLSDDQAEAVAKISTDPAQLDELLSIMERRAPGSGEALRALLNQAPARNAGEATQRKPSLSVEAGGKVVAESFDVYDPELGWVKRPASEPAQ